MDISTSRHGERQQFSAPGEGGAMLVLGAAGGVGAVEAGDVENADSSSTGEVVFTFDPDEAGQRAAGDE